MEVKLIVATGAQTGMEIPIAGPKFLIGRGEECQLRPQSSLVSRKHCAIVVEKGGAVIEDFGSTNGTFVNDERITKPRELKNGDRLRVGALAFEVRLIVSLAAPKRPKVTSVEEAVRTVARGSALNDDIDISSWLGEESDDSSASISQSTLVMGKSDTLMGKKLLETTLAPQQPHQPTDDKKAPKKDVAAGGTSGKPPVKKPLKPKADSSGQAADDALRQFFHRRRG
jgi:pSer/pThr/pTyr-binding forkhead associated (FHA) protein